MDVEAIIQQLRDTERALAGTIDPRLRSRALRTAGKLRQILASAPEPDAGWQGALDGLAAIEDAISSEPNSDDLAPVIRKANALLALEELLTTNQIVEIRELLSRLPKTRATKKRASNPLPFFVRVECLDCNKTIVGEMGGTNRWGHVRAVVSKHDRTAHEGMTKGQQAAFRRLRATLEQGSETETFQRYRVGRAG